MNVLPPRSMRLRQALTTFAIVLVLILATLVAGCATAPQQPQQQAQPQKCVAPPGYGMMALKDVDRINATIIGLQRELAACRKGGNT